MVQKYDSSTTVLANTTIFTMRIALQLRIASPASLKELLSFKFPPNAYRHIRQERIVLWPESPSSLLPGSSKFRRSPGEALPPFSLTSTVRDPSRPYPVEQIFS
ncbi:BQ2448_656 [Microbotryum intermedium]|uniref:BQ2448_656 protein n=1 Tax=Microbotryum intermedium TaxID=269621 RepID=A0A238F5X5_9BASI|nr:BQ2448_656 [Microbotryum intermedium]